MKINFLILCIFCFFLSSCNTGQRPCTDCIDTFSAFSAEFAEPSKEFGSAPLYVWNNYVTREGIDRTMTDFKDKGFGGVFIRRPSLSVGYRKVY